VGEEKADLERFGWPVSKRGGTGSRSSKKGEEGAGFVEGTRKKFVLKKLRLNGGKKRESGVDDLQADRSRSRVFGTKFAVVSPLGLSMKKNGPHAVGNQPQQTANRGGGAAGNEGVDVGSCVAGCRVSKKKNRGPGSSPTVAGEGPDCKRNREDIEKRKFVTKMRGFKKYNQIRQSSKDIL